jgi:hypothetical protein
MALCGQIGLISNPLLSRRNCREDQHGWKSNVVTRSGVAVQVPVVGIEFGRIFAGSLGAAVVLEKKPEASLTSSVAPVPIRPATPTGTCGSAPPFQECVVTSQLCYGPRRLGEGYEHPIRADGVRKMPQYSLMSLGVAGQHALMPHSLRRG